MGLEVPSMDGVRAWSGSTKLPVGEHLCEIKAPDLLEGVKAPAHRYTFVAIEGPSAGRQITDIFSLSEKARGKYLGFMQSAGVPNCRNTDELVGRRIVVIVGPDTFVGADGKEHPTTKVDGYRKAPAMAATQASAPAPIVEGEDAPF